MLCPKTEPFFPLAVSSIAAQPQNGLFLGKQIGHFCLVLGNLFNIKAAHDSQRYTCGIFMQICILCLCMPYAKLVIITRHMQEMLNIIWEECDTFWEIHKSRLQMWDTIPYFWKLEKMWSCNKSVHYQSNAMGKNFTFLSMLNQTDHLKGIWRVMLQTENWTGDGTLFCANMKKGEYCRFLQSKSLLCCYKKKYTNEKLDINGQISRTSRFKFSWILLLRFL